MPKSTSHSPFGELVKFWRSARHYSQQTLAEKTGTTPRHISFLETGRSQPTTDMIVRLSQALDLDRMGHDTLMSAGGFVDIREPLDLASAEHSRLRKRLSLPLANHDPFPAVIVDQIGDIALINRSWLGLLNLDTHLNLDFGDKANLMDFYFGMAGMRQYIVNWEQFACVVLLRFKEQQILTENQRIGELIQWLEAYDGVPNDWAIRALDQAKRDASTYSISLKIAGIEMYWKVVILGVEPQRSNSRPSLLLHQFFPGNEATKQHFTDLIGRFGSPLTHPLLCDYSS